MVRQTRRMTVSQLNRRKSCSPFVFSNAATIRLRAGGCGMSLTPNLSCDQSRVLQHGKFFSPGEDFGDVDVSGDQAFLAPAVGDDGAVRIDHQRTSGIKMAGI